MFATASEIERDRHRRAGEHHRAAGGRHGARGRLVAIDAFRDPSEVARDDEQRVVDADAEPDHRGERRGDGWNADTVAQNADDRERREQGADRGQDRQQHRDDGAEREGEDHTRGDDPDELARLGLRLGDLFPSCPPVSTTSPAAFAGLAAVSMMSWASSSVSSPGLTLSVTDR